MLDCIENYEEIDGILVITFTGELAINCSLGLFQWIKTEFLDKGYVKMVFELSDVTLIDSLGFGILVSIYKSVLLKGGNVVFVNPNESILKMLEITGFTKILKITDSVSEGVKILK